MITLSPVELLIKIASASVGACESPPNTNAGPYVERVLARTGTPKGSPWCAAQVTDWGVIALGEAWPVARSAYVPTIAAWADKMHCLHTTPQRGDLFVLWFEKLQRFAHIGLVTDVRPDGSIATIEGNTSGAGSREGWMVGARVRTLTPQDRVIRWEPYVRQ